MKKTNDHSLYIYKNSDLLNGCSFDKKLNLTLSKNYSSKLKNK